MVAMAMTSTAHNLLCIYWCQLLCLLTAHKLCTQQMPCTHSLIACRRTIAHAPRCLSKPACCPQLFNEVYFGNHFALEGTSRKKSDICKSIGAGVLIDDNPGRSLRKRSSTRQECFKP